MIISGIFLKQIFQKKEKGKIMKLFNLRIKIILFALFLIINSLIFITTTVFNEISQIRMIIFFLTVILITYIYVTINQRDNFRSLFDLYDKNVNFSKIDINGIITDTSELFCQISGYTKEELIGKHYCFLRIPYVASQPTDLLTKLEQNRYLKQEVKNVRKDGSFYWLKEEYSPKYNKKGSLIGYRVIKQDITHAKDIEQVQKEIIFNMGSIGESRSKETGNHVKRGSRILKDPGRKIRTRRKRSRDAKAGKPHARYRKSSNPRLNTKQNRPFERKGKRDNADPCPKRL